MESSTINAPTARSGVLIAVLLLAIGCEVETEYRGAAAGSGTPSLSQTEATSGAAMRFVDDYTMGYAEARRQGRPMLVFFSASWCTYCNTMATESLTDPRVVALSERFTCIVVDADKQSEVCEKFRVKALPTVQFISPAGVPLSRLTGKKSADRLLAEMQAALAAVAQRREASPAWKR